jgi:hypothetical protein
LATLLPLPKIQILDSNGNPLEGGTIFTAIPNTMTPKATYQDADSLILNTNPIVLDNSGEAIIYGSGIYRFIIKDSADNLIYDQLTADTSTGGLANGGVSTGTANAQVLSASSFSQQDGQAITFIAGFTNTTAMTVAPGGGSGIPVLLDSSTGPIPLSGGEIVQDNEVLLVYEAARGAFHLVNPTPGNFTGATISNATITSSDINTSSIVLKQSTDPTPTAEGDMQWSTLFDNFKVGSGAATKRFWAGASPGAITGCTIANNASDATNDIDFGSGTCSDSTAAFYMTLGSTLTKRLDATWAAGNNQGGLFSGSIANATYHCFIIMRPDTGVVDAGFDTSPVAANRPGSYTYFRRVGSIVRESATIKAFHQDGDYFYWDVMTLDDTVTTPGTSTITLTVPTGISVSALFNGTFTDSSGSSGFNGALFTALDTPNTSLSSNAFSFGSAVGGNGDNLFLSGSMQVRTDTSGQVRKTIGVTPTAFGVATYGWIDRRGRT